MTSKLTKQEMTQLICDLQETEKRKQLILELNEGNEHQRLRILQRLASVWLNYRTVVSAHSLKKAMVDAFQSLTPHHQQTLLLHALHGDFSAPAPEAVLLTIGLEDATKEALWNDAFLRDFAGRHSHTWAAFINDSTNSAAAIMLPCRFVKHF